MNKKLFLSVLLFTLSAVAFSQNISPRFSELKGIEDAQENTHLLYRIYSHSSDSIANQGSNDIYNFVPGTSIDSILIHDFYYCSINIGHGKEVNNYDIWNRDVSKHIYCGKFIDCYCAMSSGFIARYDSHYVLDNINDHLANIEISKQNDSLVYSGGRLLRSTDGGFTWEQLNDSLVFLSLSPFNDQTLFVTDIYSSGAEGYLYKTSDGGITFLPVDTISNPNSSFYYDINGSNIYRSEIPYTLKRSINQGNTFTWETIYTGSNRIYVSLDESQSGAIYLAEGNKIFYSSDYGTSFNLYKELDKNIVGIYKKPNSGKVYTATHYKIYEITDDSVTVIRSLPVPEEILAYYPLKVGNKWIYNYSFADWIMGGYSDIYYREVISDKIQPNGKKYFEVVEKYVYMDIADTVFERIDSLEGKIYRYSENCPGSEQLIDDLMLDVDETTSAARFDYCNEHPPTVLAENTSYDKWGLTGQKNNYFYISLVTADYHLLTDIGLDYFKLSDDNGDKTFSLKGLIKNGIVFGDTTLTDVDDAVSQLPSSYNLEQNYPNPFNPVTNIRWQSPVSSWQTIKVYDMLGNEIVTLVDEYTVAGNHEIKFDASGIPSGVYFYKLQTGSFTHTKKMILLK
jgi:hypothetical protein